jgi:hypothetical protein
MVQHPLGDGVDAEAVQHSVSNLGMPLEHQALRCGQWPGLSQQLLGQRQLAEVVQARRQARQLHVLAIETEPGRE